MKLNEKISLNYISVYLNFIQSAVIEVQVWLSDIGKRLKT